MNSRSVIFHTICTFILVAIIPAESGCNNHKNQSQSASIRDEYELMSQARVAGKYGIPFCYFAYEASDGTRIFTWTQSFRSNATMKSEYENKVKSFAEILESGDGKYINSDLNGKRIVGKRLQDKTGIERYSIVIMRSSKREISYIESSSLNNALDFEDYRYKPQK